MVADPDQLAFCKRPFMVDGQQDHFPLFFLHRRICATTMIIWDVWLWIAASRS